MYFLCCQTASAQLQNLYYKNKLLFNLSFCEPLTKALLHSLPASPVAIVDCRDDLKGLKPLDKTLHLQKAAVFTVWDSCQESRTIAIIASYKHEGDLCVVSC